MPHTSVSNTVHSECGPKSSGLFVMSRKLVLSRRAGYPVGAGPETMRSRLALGKGPVRPELVRSRYLSTPLQVTIDSVTRGVLRGRGREQDMPRWCVSC